MYDGDQTRGVTDGGRVTPVQGPANRDIELSASPLPCGTIVPRIYGTDTQLS